ncbi:DUF221-domain-containing protein [Rhizodiscina lignyota]|uniref:DUF221-domain-containing protein n=1 Tax=Rhizodiscina lignyota TaxID=1504668 RepID=A0A9P4I6G5_9PEZI|nr:DUF221-domain-containing protein [Rhizodiscina lignyota]
MDASFSIFLRRDDDAAPSTNSSSQDFLNLFSNPFQTQIQSDAALASLGTSLGFTLLVTLLFCFLRPYNTVVYAPRLRHADEKHAPPPLGKSPWAWIKPVLTTKEHLMVEKVGMDATLFLRFTRMCRNMFLVLSIVGCAILIPVNVFGGKGLYKQWTNISVLMKMTPQYMFGEIYWAFVATAYAFNIIICFFLWWNYRAVVRLRKYYFESQEYQSSLHARTLMINDIPRDLRTDEGVVKIVEEAKMANDPPRGVISRNMKELPDLIEEHEDAVRDLEAVLAKYLKNPDKLPPKRPMCKPSKKDKSINSKEKVDAIDYLTGRIKDLEARIKEVRLSIDNRNAMPYGFASYGTVDEAHGVAFAAKGKHPQGSTVRLAPRPTDIIWKNMAMSKQDRRRNGIINNLWITLLTAVWIVPNILIAVFLTNLANLGKVWPAFQKELERDPKLWAAVQGILSPAITSLFYYFLPAIFRRLSMLAGDTTKTSRDRHVTNKLYAFFVLNNLVLFSIFGALWQFVSDIISARREDKSAWEALEDSQVFSHIMIALSNLSPFWLSWLLQRNLGAAIDLSQVVNLAKSSFARRFMHPTPRQLIEWTAPPPFDYASYYNYFLFYTTVALCFATLQPLVLPVTAIYFCIDSFLKKYLVMYVFVTKTESGGVFWRILFNRMLFAMLLSDIVVALVVKANGYSWVMLGVMAGLPFLLLGFKLYCKRTFDQQIAYYIRRSLKDVESPTTGDKQSRRSDRVAVRFGHPALYKPLMTPMVHAKAQHLLGEIYHGRLDTDTDAVSVAGYSDVYSMKNMSKTQAGKKAPGSGPFEFVNESELDFENYKKRPDFRGEHGGDGELYGRPEDLIRPGTGRTYTSNSDSPSQSERTLKEGGSVLDGAAGTTYPAGYHHTPTMRESSPDRSTENILRAAAPMGVATPGEPVSPELERKPLGAADTSYDYFRGRR